MHPSLSETKHEIKLTICLLAVHGDISILFFLDKGRKQTENDKKQGLGLGQGIHCKKCIKLPEYLKKKGIPTPTDLESEFEKGK